MLTYNSIVALACLPRPSILRFLRAEPPPATPVVANIPAAEQFALSTDALEAGRAALKEAPNVIVEQNRTGLLRRHKLKSLLLGVVMIGGWFVWL